jgi:dihydroorotase
MPDYMETPRWRDMHVHVREGDAVYTLGAVSAAYCSDILVMPNPFPPHGIDTMERLEAYRKECRAACGPNCTPHMTMKLTPNTTPDLVRAAARAGVTGFKLYPDGATTNSHGGIPQEWLLNRPSIFNETLHAMQEEDLVLPLHGEMPKSFVWDREKHFVEVFWNLAWDFRKLRIVVEHITTAEAVDKVQHLATAGFAIRATITMHHLWMENGASDWHGDGLYPDRYCKPEAKRPEDWQALIRAVKNDAFFLGSDSAPHVPGTKYCYKGCAGCWTACTPGMLVTTFEKHGLLDHLVEFTSRRAGRFYRLDDRPGVVKFRKESWQVPKEIAGYTPFLAGETLPWRMVP